MKTLEQFKGLNPDVVLDGKELVEIKGGDDPPPWVWDDDDDW